MKGPQDYATRRIEYLQQLQASCDSIAVAAAKVQQGPTGHNLPSDSYAAAHARSKSFSHRPTSTSPAFSKLMQDHELAQSRLCGTARDRPPSTFTSPVHQHNATSAYTPPQSPRTPLNAPTHHDFSPNVHSTFERNHPSSHRGSHSSPAVNSSLAYHVQPQIPVPSAEFAHRLSSSSPPTPVSSFDTHQHEHNSMHSTHLHQQQQHPHHHYPHQIQKHSLSPAPLSLYTPRQAHQHTSASPQAAASIDLSASTPVHSDHLQLSTVEPYITQSDKDTLSHLRQGVIGNDATYITPFGRKRLVYADWAASGRLLTFTESFLTTQVAPWYANVHTDVGACATHTATLFEEARECVATSVHAPRCDYSVMFVGSGMTAAAFKLSHLLGLSEPAVSGTGRPVVMYSIMEHHSNCLLWRELDVDTVVIQEDAKGLPDLNQLERELQYYSSAGAPLILGSFSAGSNVTGIAPDVQAIAALLHRYGAIAAFDYASAGSCKLIDCAGAGVGGSEARSQRSITRGRNAFSDLMEDDSLDAVMLSPHKLPGGPGSSGVLVVKRSIVRSQRPQSPGGGTVRYVNERQHWFESDVERREEAGTPDVLGAIRTALALQLHTQLSQRITHALPVAHALRAVRIWQHESTIQIVGSTRSAFWDEKSRLPLVSFNVVVPVERDHVSRASGGSRGAAALPQHKALHPQFVAALLNDLFGIQARAGCACAGPYGHQLLKESLLAACGCSQKTSLHELEKLAASGNSWIKPGWVRVYFSYLMQASEVDYIIEAVLAVAQHGHKLLPLYQLDTSTGTFRHRNSVLGDTGVSKQLLRDTVNSWIKGYSSTSTDTHGTSTSGGLQPNSTGQHIAPHAYDVRHADEVLSQQLAEAQAVLSIETGGAERAARTGTAGRGAGHGIASSSYTVGDGDADCESCIARWFLLPHESNLVCARGSAELLACPQLPTNAASRPGRIQGAAHSGAAQSRGHSTGALQERQHQQLPRSSALTQREHASDRSQDGLTRQFIPSEDVLERTRDVRKAGKREEWSCSRKEMSRRDCFCPRCCAERVCGGLGSKGVLNEGHRRDQLHSARARCIIQNRSSSDSPPAPCMRNLVAESVPSSCRRSDVCSAVLQSKIAATDRASTALAAGRAALAQSIHRRKQREAVAGHKCRHMR